MGKGKSITLLTIISVLMAFVLVMSFARFPVGEVKNYNSLLGAIELDYDLEGGAAYTLTLAKDNEEEVDDINSVIKTLEYRLSALGYSVYSVKAVKSNDVEVTDHDIRIEAKYTETLAQDIAVVAAHGEVKFYGGESANPTTEILTDGQVVANAVYAGEYVNGSTTSYGVLIQFTDYGYNELVKLIDAAESSYYLEIKLGDTVLLSGSSAITTEFFYNKSISVTSSSEAGAKQMALQMANGGLAYKYDVDGGEVVTSPYGVGVETKCAVAVITLAVVLMVLLMIAYKGMGLVTALSSLLFIMIEGWLLIGVPGIVLSMGGVVGIMAATVLNAISMVILSKRVKEEYVGTQKTVKAAISKGFKQALIPTISINVIAGIFALLLFAFTSGIVKCFAITFGIGAAVSILCSLVFTRMFYVLITPLAKDKEKFFGFKRASEENNLKSQEA